MQSVKIDGDLYKELKRQAYKEEKSISSKLNKILLETLKADDLDEEKSEEIEKKERGKKIISISLDFDVYDKLKKISNKHYTPISKYINVKLKNILKEENEEKEYTNLELEELHESNYQLLAIGNNLNQLTKRINERREKVEDIDRILIQVLKEYIEDHTEKVGKLLAKEY